MRYPPDADRPLTPQNLLLDFGGSATVTRDGVRTLFDALDADQSAAVTRWTAMFGRWAGRAIDKLPQHLARLAGRYGIATDGDCPNFRGDCPNFRGDCPNFRGDCPNFRLSENGTVPFIANATRLLFAIQTYYALLVNLLAERFGHGRVDVSLPGNPFVWCDSTRSKPVGRLMERLTEACARYRIAGDCPNFRLSENGTAPLSMVNDDGECDLFKRLYQNLFPRPLRRQLGEYYTPDWLAGHVLDQIGYSGQPGRRLLDPACGSGTFLMMALRRMKKGEGGRRKTPFPLSPPSPIVGFDLNPLAVMTARANFLIALADLLPEHEPVELPIYLYDSILGRGETGGDCPNFRLSENGTVSFDTGKTDAVGSATFDFVVGNPPWIAWDNLPDADRQATKPLWERYGLFSLSGNEARHGGGKKDLSMLMLYAAADRYLKPGGRLGMVITQTLFQTKGAGDGFRRFRLGQDGPPLRVLRVDDMVALRPFGDASNWTATIALEKGAATEYPVPYFKWSERKGEGGRGKAEGKHGWHGHACVTMCDFSDNMPTASVGMAPGSPLACLARPIDPEKPTSPWLVLETENSRGPTARGAKPQAALPADYVAHLGANSGGANGVYWVEVLGESDGGVLIRNLAARGKHRVETVEHVIEPDLLYPLLRWGDVGRFSATPKAHLLLTQDPTTRLGIDQAVMQAKYPRTLAYLERFRDLLTSRAAYRRYQQGGPFYAMYNVGPYTVAPIKVVWRRMDRRINAVVVEAGATLAPQCRPPIPQETCVLVACDSSDEAHYLCAMLNSAAVNELVAGHSVRGGKGFGTPGMFDFLPLRRYRPDDPRHAELARLSRQAHAASSKEESHADVALLAELQRRIDELSFADGW